MVVVVVIVFIGIPRIVVISNSVCICFLFRQKLPLASAVETFHKEKTTHIEQYEKQQKVSTQRPVRGVEGDVALLVKRMCIQKVVLSYSWLVYSSHSYFSSY